MMRRRLHNLFLMLAALFLTPATLFASFDQVGAGARGAGMADAQTAVADDASAPFYNPAGLVQLGERRLAAEMGQYDRGLNDGSKLGSTFLGYAQPLVRGDSVIGVAYHSFGVSGLLTENTYLLGGGHRLGLDSLGLPGVLSIGANAKLLQRAYSAGSEASNAFSDSGAATGEADPLLAGNPKSSAFGFDAGLLYQFGPRLNTTVGAAMMNLNRPDVAIHAGDPVPAMLKLGVAHRPKWGLLSLEMRRTQRLGGATDTDLAAGAERYIRTGRRSALTVRGGYATGSRDYKAITAGASYSFGAFDIDYAFSFPIGNLTKTDGSQHLGLSLKFGAAQTGLTETRYEKLDLLHAFRYDSLTAHLLMTEVPGLSTDGRSIADRMLLRRFSLTDQGLAQARSEMQDALEDGRDWSLLEAGFTRGLSPEDARHASDALKAYTSGGLARALSSVAVMSAESQKRPRLIALQAMALGEKASTAFRTGKVKEAIEAVRNLTYVLPNSDLVRQALRQLQAMDTAPAIETATEEAPTPAVQKPAPAAPVVTPTVAPAVETPAPAAPAVAAPVQPEAPAAVAQPATAPVGEAAPAPVAPIIKPAAPVVVPAPVAVPAPAAVPVPVVVPAAVVAPAAPAVETPVVAPAAPVAPTHKAPATVPAKKTAPVAKPAQNQGSKAPSARSQELKRAWAFYHEAVEREVSDYEKIEILGSMLMRFGESEAREINAELERIRSRMERSSGKAGTK